MKHYLLILLAAFWPLPLFGEDKPEAPLVPTVDDTLVLLQCSWDKYRIMGKKGDEFELVVVPEGGGQEIKLLTITMEFGDQGELCLMAKDSEGTCGPGKSARYAFRWVDGPMTKKGWVAYDKPWNYKKGTTLTGIYQEASFSGNGLKWDMKVDTICVVDQVRWSPQKVTPRDATLNPDLMKRAAKLILRVIKK